MNTSDNDRLRDLIANLPESKVSPDFVARTVAAARNIEQDPADNTFTRAPWLRIASLAAAAAVVIAVSLDALVPAPESASPVAIAETEEVNLAVLVATSQLPEERLDMQLLLVLDETAEITDEDLLAFAL